MNIAAGRNHLFAKQGRASTNAEAARVRELFRQDQELSDAYNHQLAGGKWNHLMDQPHLGQFDWEPPVVDAMPAVTEVSPANEARLGVAIEGSVFTWPDHYGSAVLPAFDSFQPRRSYVEVFSIGTRPIEYTVTADQPWIVLNEEPRPGLNRRYWVSIDWAKAPEGTSSGEIFVKGIREVRVKVAATKATPEQTRAAKERFASLDGPIAFAASSATERTEVGGVGWKQVPDYGRVDAAMAIYPVTAASILPPAPAPTLEYPVYLPRAGTYTVTLVLGPVMDFVPERGMRLAVSFDDAAPQILDLFADRTAETFLGEGWWQRFTRDNARYLRSTHKLSAAGPNTVKIAMVDPGIVLQKVMIHDRPLPQSYFGPPELPPSRVPLRSEERGK